MKIKVAPSSNVLHLAMTATKIALEWTKAITFIVTVVCMLLGKSWKSKKNYTSLSNVFKYALFHDISLQNHVSFSPSAWTGTGLTELLPNTNVHSHYPDLLHSH